MSGRQEAGEKEVSGRRTQCHGAALPHPPIREHWGKRDRVSRARPSTTRWPSQKPGTHRHSSSSFTLNNQCISKSSAPVPNSSSTLPSPPTARLPSLAPQQPPHWPPAGISIHSPPKAGQVTSACRNLRDTLLRLALPPTSLYPLGPTLSPARGGLQRSRRPPRWSLAEVLGPPNPQGGLPVRGIQTAASRRFISVLFKGLQIDGQVLL